MTVMKMLLKVAGKEQMTLDERISTVYMLRVCTKYGVMKLRGIFRSLGYKNISKSIFIGKRVTLYEKKMLTLNKKVKIHDNVKIDALSTEGVTISENVVIGRNTIIECTGGLQSIGKGVSIGTNSSFGNDCFFGAAGGVKIGNDVIGGQYIRFHSENHNYNDLRYLIRLQGVSHRGIIIGNNCWIGSGATFLDGAELGDGCVVAANAVVTKKFGNNEIIAGVPAKMIGKRGELKF